MGFFNKLIGDDDVVPAGERSMLLSGLGFYRLSRHRRKLLIYVFGASLAVHVVGLLAFGGWIVMRQKKEEVTIFRTPPPAKRYEPRKLEHKVKVKKRQRSSSRPSMLPRMVSMKAANLSLPDIKVDPKLVHTTFQPNFKAVSGKGLGAGLGTGYGTHGFGAGISAINFFGIRARGERVLICVDVSVSMVEEERGGVAGYLAVKQRLGQVVNALSEASLFNLVVFADAASVMEDKMVIASPDNKTRAKAFLQPFNMQGNWGLTHGNYSPRLRGVESKGGTTRLDLALTAAFEQGADTILVISDGLPRVKKGYSPEQLAAFELKRQQWAEANASRIAAYNNAMANAQTSTEKVWVPPQPARPARPPSKRPPKEGQKPDRGSPAVPAKPGYWKTVTRTSGGGRRPQPPKIPPAGEWTLADFVRHLEILYKEVYVEQGRKKPIIHCIGYQIDADGSAFLQALAKQYHGKYRRVTKLR